MAVNAAPMILFFAALLMGSTSQNPQKERVPLDTKITQNRQLTKRQPQVRTGGSFSAKELEIDRARFNPRKEEAAIYQYIRSRYPHVNKRDARQIATHLVQYGKDNNIDPKFVAAVIAKESSFNKNAVSPTGAKGLGQIKSFNFKSLNIKNPHDIRQNVSGTTQYLKKMLKRWQKKRKDASKLALASYNMGPNAVQKVNGEYNAATKKYVDDILKYYEELKKIRHKN